MASEKWQRQFEEAWEFREGKLYPGHFGPKQQGIYVLDGELFTNVFRQDSFDPRWLTHGVFEFEPTEKRPSWVYVSSGLSNAWETDSPEPNARQDLDVSLFSKARRNHVGLFSYSNGWWHSNFYWLREDSRGEVYWKSGTVYR